MMDKNQVFRTGFLKPIIFWGMLTMLLASAFSFLPPMYLYIVHGVIPPKEAIAAGFALVFAYVGTFWIVEPPSFFPILGVPGTYMAFLSGNISNLRLPCSAIAQEAAGVKEGSDEGAIISTIGIGASVVVNLVILGLGVIIGVKLVASFPPVVKQAFGFVVPAIFGGVFGQFAIRNYRVAIVSIVLAVVLLKTQFLPSWTLTPLCIFGTILIATKMLPRKHG